MNSKNEENYINNNNIDINIGIVLKMKEGDSMSQKEMVECFVCLKEIEVKDAFNGEMMCENCYNDEENYVFGDDEDGENHD